MKIPLSKHANRNLEELRNTNITIEKSNRHLQDHMILKASILLNGLEIDCCVYLAHVDTKILQPPPHFAFLAFAAFIAFIAFFFGAGAGAGAAAAFIARFIAMAV